MTLSVCIPVYNQDVTGLVHSLLEQIKSSAHGHLVNIIIIDDHSEESFYSLNRVLSKEVTYKYLDKNIGRSKIRNKFLKYSESDYLLFIDCDSSIIDDKFILSYLNYLESEKPNVIVGSSVYSNQAPALSRRLRWKYGSQRESQSYQERKSNSRTSFKTNNFVISKTCFEKISFNEDLQGYGHEDTLFGYELKKKDIQIHHLDNPVLNGQLDTNEEFIKKTEEGLGNLLNVWKIVNYDNDLIKTIRILSYFIKYKNSVWFRSLFWVLKKPTRFILRIGFSNLHLFDFYKLGFLIELNAKTK